MTFPVDEVEFVLPVHTSQVLHGEYETVYLSYPDRITLLDKDAQDVTSQYRDAAADSSWGSGIGVAEAKHGLCIHDQCGSAGRGVYPLLPPPGLRNTKQNKGPIGPCFFIL